MAIYDPSHILKERATLVVGWQGTGNWYGLYCVLYKTGLRKLKQLHLYHGTGRLPTCTCLVVEIDWEKETTCSHGFTKTEFCQLLRCRSSPEDLTGRIVRMRRWVHSGLHCIVFCFLLAPDNGRNPSAAVRHSSSLVRRDCLLTIHLSNWSHSIHLVHCNLTVKYLDRRLQCFCLIRL